MKHQVKTFALDLSHMQGSTSGFKKMSKSPDHATAKVSLFDSQTIAKMQDNEETKSRGRSNKPHINLVARGGHDFNQSKMRSLSSASRDNILLKNSSQHASSFRSGLIPSASQPNQLN